MTRVILCTCWLLVTTTAIAQNSVTATFGATTTGYTSALLTGMRPASYKLPTGWNILCMQDFEGASAGNCKKGAGLGAYNSLILSTAQHHSGSQSGREVVGKGGTGFWSVNAKTPTRSNINEVYVSFYEYLDGAFPSPPDDHAGNYIWGGDFYRVDFHSAYSAMTLNYCCASAPGGNYTAPPFGSRYGLLLFQPQGKASSRATPNRVISSGEVGFDSSWHQFEVHYRANTNTGGATPIANSDGILEVWRDGILLKSYLNYNLNNIDPMMPMNIKVAGHYAHLFRVKNLTSYKQCSQLKCNGGTIAPRCATSMSDAPYTACACGPDGANFAKENASCPGQAAPKAFNKYIDDVIILYR